MNFKVKICGIKNSGDAQSAIDAGADAIGLNFYSKSLRSVSVEKAAAISDELAGRDFLKVGVFVNSTAEEIQQIAEPLGLDAIQLHGDESTSITKAIDHPVIRAIRVLNSDLNKAFQEINTWIDAGVDCVLLDAAAGGAYGGTGSKLNWTEIGERGLELPVPLVLAGGLTCDNVSQAVEQARPNAVDVASGIELFPGAKDREKMAKFIGLANNALMAS